MLASPPSSSVLRFLLLCSFYIFFKLNPDLQAIYTSTTTPSNPSNSQFPLCPTTIIIRRITTTKEYTQLIEAMMHPNNSFSNFHQTNEDRPGSNSIQRCSALHIQHARTHTPGTHTPDTHKPTYSKYTRLSIPIPLAWLV